MDLSDYRSQWKEKHLNKFTREQFKGLKVDDSTVEFMTHIGLPDSAAPFLSFSTKELMTIEEIYSTGNPVDNFLVEIGNDGAGDPICIDLKDQCKIVALDHEDNFAPRFVNTSVKELFMFLTVYKQFGEKLIQLRGDFAFLDSDFTDDELHELLQELKSIDPKALSGDDTFWSQEIQLFKANRRAQ